MFSKTVRVGSTTGLHVRPATLISEAAGRFEEEITVALVGEEDDGVVATSSLMLMTLGAEAGDEILVSSEDEAAVEAIAALVETDLDPQ
ncbi:HPr family phosphocarrier protein [Propionicicella superfundia]|uniref:HPr family phosphocarrier protein n=1 Tax=Propionicicella superfundia TaxID=348582 RepID=UPI00048DAAF9|nr:HPr family phosphocarrier protein [Propionicicella superfundia]